MADWNRGFDINFHYMLDIRKRLFIFIGIAAGIILAAVLFILRGSDIKVATSNFLSPKKDLPSDSALVNETPIVQTENTAPVVPTKNSSELYAKQLSRIFVERFSSFSNQNDNKNIDDVRDLSTSRMVKWLDAQVKKTEGVYSGITTEVIASSIQSIDSAKATIRVETRQTPTGENAGSSVQKTGRVELLVVDGTWKVDGFFWET